MAVSIRFFANIRMYMGKAEIMLNLTSSKHYNIRDILKQIERKEKKDLFPFIFDSNDVPLRSVRVVVNGKVIHSLDSNEMIIQDGDHIALFPLLAGG